MWGIIPASLLAVSLTRAQAPIPWLGLTWLNARRHPSKPRYIQLEKE
jgi:hypothetical protein